MEPKLLKFNPLYNKAEEEYRKKEDSQLYGEVILAIVGSIEGFLDYLSAEIANLKVPDEKMKEDLQRAANMLTTYKGQSLPSKPQDNMDLQAAVQRESEMQNKYYSAIHLICKGTIMSC